MVGDLYGDEARSSVNAGRRLGRSAACAVAIEAQYAWVYAAASNRNAASSRGKRIVKGAGVILVPCCKAKKMDQKTLAITVGRRISTRARVQQFAVFAFGEAEIRGSQAFEC